MSGVLRLGGTIVVLMGVGTLPSLIVGLLRSGLASVTPVAVVERGFSHAQRIVTATFGTIMNAGATCSNPAVIVIGDVVAPKVAVPDFFPDARGARDASGASLQSA